MFRDQTMPYFTQRYHPPGTPPGTLGPDTPSATARCVIRVVHYNTSELSDESLTTADQRIREHPQDMITWIHVQGPADTTTLQQLRDAYDLHPLAIEDVFNSEQRPKLDAYDHQLFIVMNLPMLREGVVVTEQVSLFLGRDYVLSFNSGAEDPFEPVRKRLQGGASALRTHPADYLLYALLDTTIDHGFPSLEALGEKLERVEEELLLKPDQSTLRDIHRIKHELLLLRRMLWPQREVLNTLLRDSHPLIRTETKLYLRDCYDHTIQIMDLLETYRDMASGMIDVYLSTVSNRLNDVMRVLTIIATIFIPLTFITGVYGMNFGNNTKSPWAMPELNWYYGYPLIWLVLITVAVLLLVIFKRKRWF
ncbi:MAG: magnesium/cobalt transporter CorA [Gammaproteobacteria bacterium]|nr:magnesium/cobalt transporter CorA [Gammaproteobacteria bacterium]